VAPALLLLAATLLPTAPAAQAIELDLLLGDSLEQFSPGTFQRTALNNSDIDGPGGRADLLGGIQLVPVGAITVWRQAGAALPEPRTETASVYLGGRLYVIGGEVVPAGSAKQPTASVVSTQIQQNITQNPDGSTTDSRGEPIGIGADAFRTESPLPAPPPPNPSDPDAQTAAPRAAVSAVALARSAGGGFIYVVGGSVQAGVDRLSTANVAIGSVAADGTITWRNGPPLVRDNVSYPIQSAATLIHTAANGKTYLYVIGGFARFESGFATNERGRRSTLRAEINTATGDLVTQSGGSAWEKMPEPAGEIPVLDDDDISGFLTDDAAINSAGLWNTGVIVNRTFSADGLSFRDVVFAIGGQIGSGAPNPTPELYTSKTFRGFIDQNGMLAWDRPSTYVATLQQAIVSHTAASYNGNVYAIGGFPATDDTPLSPLQSTQASFIQDDSTLAVLNDAGTERFEFVRNDNTIPEPRFSHATAVVPAGPTRAYVYVIGGQGNDSAEAKDTIYFGVIGDDSGQNVRYAPGGFYYSQPVDITRLANVSAAEGQLKNFSWTTSITQSAGLDVQLEYRFTNAINMPANQPWLPITATLAQPGFGSVDGLGQLNTAELRGYNGELNPSARLVQFRARLNSGVGLSTPTLHNVAIRVSFPGAPNLKPDPDQPFITLTDVTDGKPLLNGIQVKVANRDSAEAPTRPAYFETGGFFYVDLYINPASRPPSFGTQGVAFAIVPKSLLDANSTVTIGSTTPYRWCSPTNLDGCTPVDIPSLLRTPGSYEIYAYVDQQWPDEAASNPTGLVKEGLPGSPNESDNVTTTPLRITIASPDDPPTPGCDTLPLPPTCPLLPGQEQAGDGAKRFPLIMYNAGGI
jgi:hypothetical protein